MVISNKNTQNQERTGAQLIHREKQERQATATLVSDTIKALNITINLLPQRCQELLYNTATLQNQLNIQSELISLPLLQSKYTLILLKEEYEFLVLKEENLKLQKEIERNKNFLENLRAELEELRRVLPNQNLNPSNIYEFLRQMKQKSTSYDEIYGEMKAKFIKLQVPVEILPDPLMEMATRLTTLKAEEMVLKQKADEVTLFKSAFYKIRRH